MIIISTQFDPYFHSSPFPIFPFAFLKNSQPAGGGGLYEAKARKVALTSAELEYWYPQMGQTVEKGICRISVVSISTEIEVNFAMEKSHLFKDRYGVYIFSF